MNNVYWVDVIIFEDNSFVLEAYNIDVVETFKKKFNQNRFTSVEQLESFFGNNQLIYDCNSFVEYVTKKYNRPFKILFLDGVELSLDMEKKIKQVVNLAKCGGYINKIPF